MKIDKDIFSKDEVKNIQKTIKWLKWTLLSEYKDWLKSMIEERQAASRPSTANSMGKQNFDRMEQEAVDIDSGKKNLAEFRPQNNQPSKGWRILWADPMLLQQQMELANTQRSQVKDRFNNKAIGQNVPQQTPREKNIWSQQWPNWEVVRKNSRWQYYYIDKIGNAVIVNNKLDDALKNM